LIFLKKRKIIMRKKEKDIKKITESYGELEKTVAGTVLLISYNLDDISKEEKIIQTIYESIFPFIEAGYVNKVKKVKIDRKDKNVVVSLELNTEAINLQDYVKTYPAKYEDVDLLISYKNINLDIATKYMRYIEEIEKNKIRKNKDLEKFKAEYLERKRKEVEEKEKMEKIYEEIDEKIKEEKEEGEQENEEKGLDEKEED